MARPAIGASAAGLRSTRPVLPASTSSSVRSERSRRAASRSISPSRARSSPPDGAVGAIAGQRRRGGRLGRVGGRRHLVGQRRVVGHASHRVKTSAVFCPPNPNEFDSATRTSHEAAWFGVRSSPAAAGVGIREVDRRRDAAVADGEDRGDRLDRPGRTQGVAEHRLVGRDRERAGVVAEDRLDGLELGLVALGRRGRMGVDVLHLLGRDDRPSRAHAARRGPPRCRRAPAA